MHQPTGTNFGDIYVCHRCFGPTFFDNNGDQTPSVTYGNNVSGITDDTVQKLYDEARRCTGCNAYTATVLCCRKLLMHIAVAKGADEGKNFIEYVQYFADKNYIPPDARDWVDHIRTKGNEANHKIVIMAEQDAKDLLAFSEMLLKIIYEFPATVKSRVAATQPQTQPVA